MFGLSSFRLYAAIFALVALVALVAGGYIYVTKMQTKITTLEVESRLAQEALKTSNETIDAIEKRLIPIKNNRDSQALIRSFIGKKQYKKIIDLDPC